MSRSGKDATGSIEQKNFNNKKITCTKISWNHKKKKKGTTGITDKFSEIIDEKLQEILFATTQLPDFP